MFDIELLCEEERKGKIIFLFERGCYNGGDLRYKIRKIGKLLLFEGRAYNNFCYMEDYRFTMPESAIKGIARVLKPVEKWEKEYNSPDGILDGYGWSIRFNYDGKNISSEGYMEFPANYQKVVRQIQREIEKLCKEYSPAYSEEGIRERLSL